jgi:membrane fusion protein, heavy metal efflux system
MRFVIAGALCAAVLFAAQGLAPGHAHEGHDHGPRPVPTQANAAPRGEAKSSAFELVAIAQGTELVIYLDKLATNEPVQGASVEVETPDGSASATAANGFYRLKAPWLTKPGHVDLIVTVTVDNNADVMPVSLDIPDRVATPGSGEWTARISALFEPTVVLSAGFGLVLGIALMSFGRRRATTAAALLAAALTLANGNAAAQDAQAPTSDIGTDRASRSSDGVVFVPKPIQRIFGLRTTVTEDGVHPRSVELPGRIIPDPNASGYVQTSVGGRLSAPPDGFPRLGTPVRQGDVLAQVTPPMQAIDVSDMRQRQGELDQQIDIVQRRLARYERLGPSGAIPFAQLEETRFELQGLKDRRSALDTIRRTTEALVAPVSGVVAEGTPIAGQMAQPNAVVFHIIDPARLWIEALSFEAMANAKSASAVTANGRILPLEFRGSGLADRNQSIPVHFAMLGAIDGLRAGQFVNVFVATGEEKRGIAIPRASLVRSANGQDMVYVHVAAERFEPRPVNVEPLDGGRVLVSAGIEAGQRVVVQGAELLDHVR